MILFTHFYGVKRKENLQLQIQTTWTRPFSGTRISRDIFRHDFEQNSLSSNFFFVSEVSRNDRTNRFFTKNLFLKKTYSLFAILLIWKELKHLKADIRLLKQFCIITSFYRFPQKYLCCAERHTHKKKKTTIPHVTIKSFCETTYVCARAINNIYNYFTQHVWMWIVSKLPMTYCNRTVVSKTSVNVAYNI